jgi:DNA-binding NtrC family response regulator
MTSSEPSVSPRLQHPFILLCFVWMTKSLQRLLMAAGFDVVTATGGEQGLLQLEKQEFAVIISDMRMPGMTGLSF